MSPLFTYKSNYLFDFDGTLVDSSALHEMAFRLALDKHSPGSVRGFDYELAKGRKTRDVFVDLQVGDSKCVDRLTDEKQRIYRSLLERGDLRLMAGARRLLEFLVFTGRVLYLVTSGSRASVERALSATRIGGYFTGVVTADDVASSKPDPAIYLACLEHYQLPPAGCVSIEDAESGVRASAAAGIDCVVVGQAPPEHAGALAVFPTLGDLQAAIARASETAYAS